MLPKHSVVETLHQLRSRLVVHVPQTNDYAAGSGIYEALCKSNQSTWAALTLHSLSWRS